MTVNQRHFGQHHSSPEVPAHPSPLALSGVRSASQTSQLGVVRPQSDEGFVCRLFPAGALLCSRGPIPTVSPSILPFVVPWARFSRTLLSNGKTLPPGVLEHSCRITVLALCCSGPRPVACCALILLIFQVGSWTSEIMCI